VKNMGFVVAILIMVPYLTIASIDSKNKHEERIKNIRKNCETYFQDPNCYEKLTGIDPETHGNADFRDLPRYTIEK
jgi:hypothetical protein